MLVTVETNIMLDEQEFNSLFSIQEFDYYAVNREDVTFDYIENFIQEMKLQEEQKQQEMMRLRAIEEEEQRIASVTFNPNDLTIPSNLNKDEMYDLLKDTGLKDVAHTYIEAEQKYGVNSFFLLGLSALESAWGTSSRAVNDNNLTGYNITSNSAYYSFSSRSESLLATAKLLSNDYLNKNGRYYNGKTAWDVNKNYCPPTDDVCKGWADKIVKIAQDVYFDYKSVRK